jgi:alpha-L-rhamnosidase
MVKQLSCGIIFMLLIGGPIINISVLASPPLSESPLFWMSPEPTPENTHGAFRGKFTLPAGGTVEFQLSGASWYVVWLDGKYFYEGPDRYPAAHPEYQSKQVSLSTGDHVIAIQVQFEGIETRILDAIQPFLYCSLLFQEKELPVTWKCERLQGFESGFRINAELGWVEWVDTRKVPENWQDPRFDDSGWKVPVQVTRELGPFSRSKIGNVKALEIKPKLMAEGRLAEVYGYEKDNPSARFFLRDLVCEKLPSQGVWKRYDLGRVRLSRPKFLMDLPAGAVVEFAYCESLIHDRVSPWITLSTSDSYNLDHFVARGGRQEFFPLHPKGGRFVEVHILAPSSEIRFIEEKFLERCYYDQPEGDFTCNDELLNKIWRTGIETYRACSEDALIDNPTRERGQWIGDMGVGGMRIGAAGFSDIRICRRGLVQSAQCAREDGMVAGLCPGGEGYLSSFSAQWVPACLNYCRLTGDKSLLEELYPAAEKNIAAFQHYLTQDGISYDAGWAFIDWGYVPNPEASDMGLNLHYFMALQSMVKWSALINRKDRIIEYEKLEAQIFTIIQRYFVKNSENGRFQWDKIGYHRIVLGMLAGFIPPDQQKEAVAFVKKHILNCFPNNPDAPRLSDPGANNPQLITPYFSHFAFQVLIEQGEMEFVLNQYRKCWGWALEDGRTTWVEVFDTRWSNCHQWAGSPTWQLSTYVLGLTQRFDQKKNSFDLKFYPGDLMRVTGKIPLPGGNTIAVNWEKSGNTIEYEIITPEPITINIPKEMNASKKGLVTVKDRMVISIQDYRSQ